MKIVFIRQLVAVFARHLSAPIWAAAIVIPIAYTAIGVYEAARHVGDPIDISSTAEYESVTTKLTQSLQA
jgi:hypothetical protein